MIPKIIHQTYFSHDLPSGLCEAVGILKVKNPHWEYRFYDDTAIIEFIKLHYDQNVLAHYDRINPKYGAARADLFRYLLLYQCGGIYLDIKSSASRPLDDVIRPDDSYLISNWKNKPGEEYEGWGLHAAVMSVSGGEFQQWYIAAEPGHPFLAAVIKNVLGNIDKYHPSWHGTGKAGVLWLTGPIVYTLSIAPLLKHHAHRVVESDRDLGLRYTVFNDLSHRVILRSHYTKLTESIVNVGFWKRFTARLIDALRSARNFILRREN